MSDNIRKQILKILIYPTTVSEIKKKLPKVKSLGTIAYHLKNLENENVITKNKETKKQGQPTTYKISSQEIAKRMKKFQEIDNARKLDCLKFIKESPQISDNELLNKLVNEGYEEDLSADTILNLVNDNLSTMSYTITEKGLKYLKKK